MKYTTVKKRSLTAKFLVVIASLCFLLSTPNEAFAASCYGPSCNGLNPPERCEGDAITVGAVSVTHGMLELRYSPSCVANWGRYTPYMRDATFFASQGKGIYARVTVWNPGSTSYGTAYHAVGIYGTGWSQMTDGCFTACTGVEVGISIPDDENQSQGWDWGPCR